MSFQVKSRLYLGLTGVKWSQYATYFHLGPIQGLYKEDMLVIYHDFEGNLPFTGILQKVYGLPYATSTHCPLFLCAFQMHQTKHDTGRDLRCCLLMGSFNHFAVHDAATWLLVLEDLGCSGCCGKGECTPFLF